MCDRDSHLWSPRPRGPIIFHQAGMVPLGPEGLFCCEMTSTSEPSYKEMHDEKLIRYIRYRRHLRCIIDDQDLEITVPWNIECLRLKTLLDEVEHLLHNQRPEIGFIPVGETDFKWGYYDDPVVQEVLSATLGSHDPKETLVYKTASSVDYKTIGDKLTDVEKSLLKQQNLYRELHSGPGLEESLFGANCSSCGKSARSVCVRCTVNLYIAAQPAKRLTGPLIVTFEGAYLRKFFGAPTEEESKRKLATTLASCRERLLDPDHELGLKLHDAILMNRPSLVRHFLIMGAHPNTEFIVDIDGENCSISAVAFAARVCSAAIVKLLLDWGGEANPSESYRFKELCPLMLASMSGSMDVARLLLDASADVKCFDECGRTTALLVSCGPNMANNPDMVKMLIDAGSDVDHRDIFGLTPLSHAVMGEKAACIQVFLAAVADVNAMSEINGGTPLIHAVIKANLSIVTMLVQAGADPLLVLKSGMASAVDIAKGGAGDNPKWVAIFEYLSNHLRAAGLYNIKWDLTEFVLFCLKKRDRKPCRQLLSDPQWELVLTTRKQNSSVF